MVAQFFRSRPIDGRSLATIDPTGREISQGIGQIAQAYAQKQMREQDREYQRGLIADERAYQEKLAQDEMMRKQEAAERQAMQKAQDDREARLLARYIMEPDAETRNAFFDAEIMSYDTATQDDLDDLLNMDYEQGKKLAEVTLIQSGYKDVLDNLRGGSDKEKKEELDKIFERTNKLREQVKKADPDFGKTEDAYSRIQASAEDPSAAGDLALIFNYMKMLDPGSTVREGEFATAQNAAGVDARIVNVYNRLIDGQRLNPEQRSDFLGRAGKLYDTALTKYDKRTAGVRKQAEKYGIPLEDIFPERMGLVESAPAETVEASVTELSDEDLFK